MPKITTNDCRLFLVDTFSKPNAIQIVVDLFDPLNPPPSNHIQGLKIANKWKRHGKYKIGSNSDVMRDLSYREVFTEQNRWVEEPSTNFIWCREFYHDDFEGQVGYLILESTNGDLVLGSYIGD